MLLCLPMDTAQGAGKERRFSSSIFSGYAVCSRAGEIEGKSVKNLSGRSVWKGYRKIQLGNRNAIYCVNLD